MVRLHLLNIDTNSEGIYYRSSDEAPAFIGNLRTSYNQELKVRARWLAKYLSSMEEEVLENTINQKIGRWAIEFPIQSNPGNTMDFYE
ncbi:MAG: hypothetical protein IPN13_17225 [Bacteroidetes bacterium]|nr:hypothetical protein [Bacteroidota bacterium]